MREGRLRLLVGPDYDGAADAWRDLPVSPPPVIVVHPVTARLAVHDVEEAHRVAERAVLGATSNAEARTRFAGRYLANTLINVPTICSESDAARLSGLFKGRPAIVVAAGPSLDRNLTLLERHRDRVVLIAVDTAVRPLLSAGLEPDLIVSVDPSRANARHLIGLPALPRSWFVAEGSIDPRVFGRFEGRTFVYRVSDHHPWPWLASHGCARGHLHAWGSVLTTAFDWHGASEAGCDPIVFAAADLAYTADGPTAAAPSMTATGPSFPRRRRARPRSRHRFTTGPRRLNATSMAIPCCRRRTSCSSATGWPPGLRRLRLVESGMRRVRGILHGSHIRQVAADQLDLPEWPEGRVERPALLNRAWRSTQHASRHSNVAAASGRSLTRVATPAYRSTTGCRSHVTRSRAPRLKPAWSSHGVISSQHGESRSPGWAANANLIMRALEDSGDPMDQLLTARRERDRARTERDTAFTARDTALGERDEARRERDTLLRAGTGVALTDTSALVNPLTQRVIALDEVVRGAGLQSPMTEYDAAMIYRELALANEHGQPTPYKLHRDSWPQPETTRYRPAGLDYRRRIRGGP